MPADAFLTYLATNCMCQTKVWSSPNFLKSLAAAASPQIFISLLHPTSKLLTRHDSGQPKFSKLQDNFHFCCLKIERSHNRSINRKTISKKPPPSHPTNQRAEPHHNNGRPLLHKLRLDDSTSKKLRILKTVRFPLTSSLCSPPLPSTCLTNFPTETNQTPTMPLFSKTTLKL